MPQQFLDELTEITEEIDKIEIEELTPQELNQILKDLPEDDSRPPDAHSLHQNELLRELTDRGLQPKGFFNDDAATLQVEYNKEHYLARDIRRQQIIETATKKYQNEKLLNQKRQQVEEIIQLKAEVEKDNKLQVWLDLIKRNKTPEQACIRVNSITAIAVSKTMCFNHSLRSLDLSNNGLEDITGKHLGILLRKNQYLMKLELNCNAFGPSTAKELALALQENKGLKFLSLESNPLTNDEMDYSGILALGKMLTVNNTLTALNLWKTGIGKEGGKAIANGIQSNSSLLFLELGNNDIGFEENKIIRTQLEENNMNFGKKEKRKKEIQQEQKLATEKEKIRQEENRKAKEHEQWVEEQRLSRASERQQAETLRQQKIAEEAIEFRREAARIELERKTKEENEKKKKTKKKGKITKK